MYAWLWEHVALPSIGFAIEVVPWWAWALLAGLLVALAIKLYKVLGWQGIVGALVFILTVGAYRQGWRNAWQRHNEGKFDAPVPLPRVKRKRPTFFDMFNRD